MRTAILYLSALFFVLLIVVSCLLYNGGTPFDLTKKSYSFTHNFLSDLGREETFKGEDNSPSRYTFTAAMTVIAFALVLLTVSLRKYLSAEDKNKFTVNAAIACGLISALFLLASGLAPWDKMFFIHVWSVNISFTFLFFFLVLTAITQFKNGFNFIYPAANIFTALSILAQGLILFLGPHYRTRHGLPVQATVQKIEVMIFLGNLIIQASALNVNKKTRTAIQPASK